MSDSQDNSERFCERAALLSDTVVTQTQQLSALRLELRDCDTRSRAAAEGLDATRADLLASQQLINHHEGALREELDRGIALRQADKDHFEVVLEEMRADLLVCQKFVDSMVPPVLSK